jgi:hypothetical protein
MAEVWPCVADTPLVLVSANREVRLPGIAALSPFLEPSGATAKPEVAVSAPGPTPAPVESWLRTASQTVPTIAARATRRLPETAPGTLVASSPLPAIAGPATGPVPMGAERMLVSSAATARAPFVPAVQMQALALLADVQRTTLGFERSRLRPVPPASQRPDNVVVLRPIWTIGVTPPEQQNSGPVTTIPQPGFIPVEYHAQRMRSEPACTLPWQTPRLQPAPPRFVVRAVFDRVEEEALAQKPARKEPAFAEVFAMPEAKKRSNRSLGMAGKAIAAGLVIGGMWLGTSVVRLSRQPVSVSQNVFGSPATSSPSAALSAGTRQTAPGPGPAEATGPMAWMHKALANRASYQAGDNFHDGMQAWGSAPKAFSPGWQRHPDGYVRPGDLAIFSPSLKLSDYRFEFFGQVDRKSMGWVVRAKDPDNYYAMKVKVLEAGLRPIIAVIHYPVVGGKPGHQVETPLNVMVHNNKPFQVAINVKGSHFSASIEGEEVDSWSDAAFPSGGVGFFAEAGESARLYWMKVTRNDDWLGRVCSMLAGSDSGTQTTSELWGPGFGDPHPGGVPRPASPEGAGNVSLAAAGLGLPGFKARRTRDSKYGRYQPWSS